MNSTQPFPAGRFIELLGRIEATGDRDARVALLDELLGVAGKAGSDCSEPKKRVDRDDIQPRPVKKRRLGR
jgi:hypothetical protein